jgi:hypothetical protein
MKKVPKMSVYSIPAEVIADIVNTKTDTVYKQRQGKRVGGMKAKQIELADNLYALGHNELIEKIKRVVRF